MSRTLFENSKAALAFAAVTLIGAVSMVGTSNEGGMLPKLVERFGSKPVTAQPVEASAEATESASEKAPPPAPKQVSGWYDTPSSAPTIDTDDNADDTAGDAPAAAPDAFGAAPADPQPGAAGTPGGGPMNAPLSPTAVVVN